MQAAVPMRVRDAGPDTRLLLTVCAGAAALVLGLWVVCASSAPRDVDQDIYASIHGSHGTTETSFARHLTRLGNGAPLILFLAVLCAAVWFAWRRWEPIAVTILALVLGNVTSDVVKIGAGRHRPPTSGWLATAAGNSFPSGHTTAATAGYLALAMSVAVLTSSVGLRVLVLSAAVALAAGVGWTRVELGVHWPTDVLAGWLIGAGAACAALSCWAIARPALRP